MDYRSRQKKFQRHSTARTSTALWSRVRRICATFAATRAATGYCYFSMDVASSSPMAVIPNRRVKRSRAYGWSSPKVRSSRTVAKIVGKLTSAAIGFEADYTTVASAALMRKLVHRPIHWRPTSGLIIRQRMIKDPEELSIIRNAVKMGEAVYEEARASIRPGVRESEVAGKLEYAARQAGADGMSFETIVAAGRRGALPHGRASAQPIPRRGFVVVDSGVILRGYCSDMTRTVHVGRVGREERRWYEAVLEAQLAGIAEVIPGKTAGQVDQAARQVLRRAKLDRYFTHSTGHGVGLEIHEPPRLGKGQSERLEPGMVITIEPGIYLPGKGGIRIEDMVVVTETRIRSADFGYQGTD